MQIEISINNITLRASSEGQISLPQLLPQILAPHPAAIATPAPSQLPAGEPAPPPEKPRSIRRQIGRKSNSAAPAEKTAQPSGPRTRRRRRMGMTYECREKRSGPLTAKEGGALAGCTDSWFRMKLDTGAADRDGWIKVGEKYSFRKLAMVEEGNGQEQHAEADD